MQAPKPDPPTVPQLTPTARGQVHTTILSLTICLGAFVFSYNAVCLTQVAQLLQLKNNLSKDEFVIQLSIATACFNFGSFISPILYRRYVGIFGELRGVLIIDCVTILMVGVEMIELQFWVLASARLVMGFMLGISTAIIPVYINSITPPSIIGKLGTYNQLLITLGAVISYTAGSIIIDDASDEVRWRIYLALPAFFTLLRMAVLQLFYRFETLERHMERKQFGDIRRYCRMVYGNQDEGTVEGVVRLKSFKKMSQENTSNFKRRFIIALAVIASNQLTGINGITYYAKQLFNKITDGDSEKSQMLIIIMAVIQVFATFISSRFVDKLGRKVLILNGQIFIAACLIFIFIFDELLTDIVGADTANICIIVLIFLHLIGNNMTVGPCCIIYCTEIVEDITWMIVMLKGLALLMALTSQYMIEYIGIGFMFLIFFGFTLAVHIFLRTRLKETKGLTTSEIYASFAKESNRDVKDSLLQAESENSLSK